MAVWLVRAGKYGEAEQIAIEQQLVTIGWNEVPNLSAYTDRETFLADYRRLHPTVPEKKLANHVGQVWRFLKEIALNDLVVLPLKTRSAVAIGKVIGSYEYRTDLGDGIRHIRRVKWLRTDIPRTAFDQDILHTFGASMTVCKPERNEIEKRLRAMLNLPQVSGLPGEHDTETQPPGEEVDLEIEQVAGDQILEFIQRRFAGHKLAVLVDAVLKAEGYETRVSPPGPDGGVDILAGTAPMGFGSPRLCVQVKSSSTPAEVNVLRGLQGVLQNFHAEHGLLVCWGGFTQPTLTEARQSFFSIRLWDSGKLLEMVLKHHDKFSDELKAELPLKRVWALVVDEE